MKKNNSGEVKYGRSVLRCTFSAIFNVISGVFLGAFVIFLLGVYESETLKIVAQVISLFLYVVMIYLGGWHEGDRDRNLVRFKHIEPDLLKGLKFGILAMIPFTLMTVLLIVAMYVQNETAALVLRSSFRILNFNIIIFINSFMSPDVVTWKGIGLMNLFYLSIPALSAISYIFGYKKISIYEKTIYKSKDSDAQNKKSGR
ncbi:MAG: hypothetical protein IJF27_02925 [Oscillospiraceae bacterium]|nr:hypothetical protein [Oscillospiraceae bacterium]